MAKRVAVGAGQPRYLIVAPPPTPNGGFHIGHLSGPYLAADVFRRECLAQGHETHLAVSTDDHQIYVDVSAARLGVPPEELIAKSRQDIEETAALYSLGIGSLGRSDNGYGSFVTDFFKDALDRKLIEVADVPVAVDRVLGSRMEGPQITGACPSCLAPACGGICESCGDPNGGFDLVPDTAPGSVSIAREPRLTLDLEAYRPFLADFFAKCEVQSPKLRAKLSEWMSKPLGRFLLSGPAPRGLDAPAGTPPGQKLNVWAEMYPGHFHHLERACSPILPTDRYVQFLGFDNSYFYTIVHGALARIAQICGHDWPLPERLVINRFYNLGFEKFSTSRGVVVWANDLARRHDPDLIRLFLALHGPEHDEASFDAAAADERIRQLATILDRVATSFNASGLPADTSLSGPLARFFARIPALRSSMREIATSALHCLEFITRGIGASDEQTVRQAPLALKMSLASLCPVFTDRIRLGDHCRIPQFASAERMLLFE